MRYPLAVSSWDEKEIAAIQDVVNSGRFTMGARVKEFETAFATYFGSKYAIMVNSGSSANLLVIAASVLSSQCPLEPGDEVIVPAVSWSTTYFPIHQYGMVVKIVDVDTRSFNLDLDQVEAAVGPRTRAILAVNLLGAPNDFERLKDICDRHELVLLEDNCESMGATFNNRYAGTFGLAGSFSTFFSHHISTMEGGVIVTDSEEMYHTIVSLRAHGWTRELPKTNLVHNKEGDDFKDSYRFVLPGYNLRPLEFSGAIGLKQLEKLDAMLEERRQNAAIFTKLFGESDYVSIQVPHGESSWFGFALVFQGILEGERELIVRALTSEGIECRPIVAGNFARNPVVQRMSHNIHGELTNADNLHQNGLFVGNHHYDLTEELHLLRRVLDSLARNPW